MQLQTDRICEMFTLTSSPISPEVEINQNTSWWNSRPVGKKKFHFDDSNYDAMLAAVKAQIEGKWVKFMAG